MSSLTEYASEKLYGEKMFNNLAGGMLRPVLQEIGSTGLRAWLQQNLPDLDIHQIALDAIAGGLAGGIDMDLGTIGRVHVDYRNNVINLTPSGIAGIVGATSVSDQQIVSIIDDLLDQVEAKYIDKPDYLLGEVDKIVTQVSEYGVASLDDGQKSLYDLVFVLLTGHYAGHEDAPAWTETALEGIRSGALIQNLINDPARSSRTSSTRSSTASPPRAGSSTRCWDRSTSTLAWPSAARGRRSSTTRPTTATSRASWASPAWTTPASRGSSTG